MKALVVSSLYQQENRLTGQVVHRQCVELLNAGVSVEVICPIPRGVRGRGPSEALRHLLQSSTKQELDGISVTYVPYWNVPHALSPNLDARHLTRALVRTLKTSVWDYDLIHAHRLFPTAYAALELNRRSGRPLVVTVHGSDIHTNPVANPRVGRLTTEVIRSGATVTTVSEALAKDVVSFCPCPTDPVVTYLGVDTDVFRPTASPVDERRKLGLAVSGPCIATVSRLHPDKGIAHLIDAFASLRSSAGEAWVLIVGDGPAKSQLEGQVERLGLASRVVFAGPKPHAVIGDWLRAADIFVLPSKKEGLPNSVLEAMSSGLPVVATDVGGIGEAVTPECGRLVPYGDVQALATALRDLIDSPELRSSQGRSRRTRAIDVFGWPASASRLISVYEAAVRGSSAHV